MLLWNLTLPLINMNKSKDIDILVVDNFLTPTYFKQIQYRILYGIPNIHWFYNPNIAIPPEDQEQFPEYYKDELYYYGFGHPLFDNGRIMSNELYPLLSGYYSQVLDTAGCNSIMSSNMFMTTFSGKKRKLSPHIDEFMPHLVALFYLTDSDAETVIYDEKITDFNSDDGICERYSPQEYNNFKIKQKIIPKENRIVIFNGSYVHGGSTPGTTKNRIVINTDIC